MAFFRDEDELYAFIGRMLEDLVADEDLGPRFQRANTIAQYRYEGPDATITVRMLEGEPPLVVCGETDMVPEIVMTMDADTAHHFFLGKVNIACAIARREISTSGPVSKILKLIPLVKPAFPRYQAWLQESGREDLVTA